MVLTIRPTIPQLQHRDINFKGTKAPFTMAQQTALKILYEYNASLKDVAEFFSATPSAILYHYGIFRDLEGPHEELTIKEILLKEGYIDG